MLKIITANTNGIRAAARKGFFEWLAKENPDIVCIQETKAQFEQLQDNPIFSPKGYHCQYHDAEKKGYSGVAIYSKMKPQNVVVGSGWDEVDCEGRYLEFQFANVNVVSLYMHSGTAGSERQQKKYEFMAKYYERLMQLKDNANPYIICGDINIAHTEKDIKNAKGNKNNSGFLPEEREWMSKLFSTGYSDAFRVVDTRDEQYTWWSNRGRAWENNTGWRIDYQIISDTLEKRVRKTAIYKDERFSDHAPLIMEYDLLIEE